MNSVKMTALASAMINAEGRIEIKAEQDAELLPSEVRPLEDAAGRSAPDTEAVKEGDEEELKGDAAWEREKYLPATVTQIHLRWLGHHVGNYLLGEYICRS